MGCGDGRQKKTRLIMYYLIIINKKEREREREEKDLFS
jgi:hypothetical protein